MLLRLIANPRGVCLGIGVRTNAGAIGVDAPSSLFAFRRPVPRLEIVGSGLDVSNIASDDLEGFRARLEESI